MRNERHGFNSLLEPEAQRRVIANALRITLSIQRHYA